MVDAFDEDNDPRVEEDDVESRPRRSCVSKASRRDSVFGWCELSHDRISLGDEGG